MAPSPRRLRAVILPRPEEGTADARRPPVRPAAPGAAGVLRGVGTAGRDAADARRGAGAVRGPGLREGADGAGDGADGCGGMGAGAAGVPGGGGAAAVLGDAGVLPAAAVLAEGSEPAGAGGDGERLHAAGWVGVAVRVAAPGAAH